MSSNADAERGDALVAGAHRSNWAVTGSSGAPSGSAGSSNSAVAAAEPSIATARERRIMPTRLRRAANLLAGSAVEDELNGILVEKDPGSGLAGTTAVLLTTQDVATEPINFFANEQVTVSPHKGDATPLGPGSSSSMTRVRDFIETPDFRELTDTEVMGKTRSLRSEEDTSDAAYERRHRRPDNVEKKQRRLERENLARDRQKLRDRIEQLKQADARMLMDIVTVREQRQREQSEQATSSAAASTPKHHALEGAAGSASSSSSQSNTARMEQLRRDLIEEANVMLQRYDALLCESDAAEASLLGKRKKTATYIDDGASASTADDSDAVPSGSGARSLSGRGVSLRVKRSTNRGSPVPTSSAAKQQQQQRSGLRASASTGSIIDTGPAKKPNTKHRYLSTASSPGEGPGPGRRRAQASTPSRRASTGSGSVRSPSQPFSTTDGPVRAEHTYANIHARTSGGRFAPKKALAKLDSKSGPPSAGSKSRINTKSGNTKGKGRVSHTASTSVDAVSPSPLPPPQQAPAPAPTPPSAGKRRPGRPRKASIEAIRDAQAAHRTVSSASAASSISPSSRSHQRNTSKDFDNCGNAGENEDEPRRRLKLVLRRGGGGSSGGGTGTGADEGSNERSPMPAALDTPVRGMKQQEGTAVERMEVDGDEEDTKPATSAALTVEEAQALFAQAMADGGSSEDGIDADMDEDARDAAAAAAAIVP